MQTIQKKIYNRKLYPMLANTWPRRGVFNAEWSNCDCGCMYGTILPIVIKFNSMVDYLICIIH